MHRLLALPLLLLLAASDAPPRPALILFWADWCAPCRVEMRQLAAIEAAARPLPVSIVALSPTGALTRAGRERLIAPDGGGWAYLAAMKLPPALPAAAIVDRSGKACATHRGGIDAAKAAALVASCQLVRKQ